MTTHTTHGGVDVAILVERLAAAEARVTVLTGALEDIAKGVWIARADACLETIEWMARQGLEKAKRAAVETARAALAAEGKEGEG